MELPKSGDLRSRPSFPMPTVVEVLSADAVFTVFRWKRRRHSWPTATFLAHFPEDAGRVEPKPPKPKGGRPASRTAKFP